MNPPRDRLEITLHPVPQSAGIARTFVTHHLVSRGLEKHAEDAALIATELVTNAVREAPHTPVRLFLTVEETGRLLIEVWDASPDPPVPQRPGPYAASGRGLLITRALSSEVGYHLVGNGKVVWSRLPG
ncbi:MAG TPA: ATP-binding protein [Gemmatimonadales bacterium]|nr:ATP-binding protein [Gemmatimonadales bacterium]